MTYHIVMVSASVALEMGDHSGGRHLRLLVCYIHEPTRQRRRDMPWWSVHVNRRLYIRRHQHLSHALQQHERELAPTYIPRTSHALGLTVAT
jgi:hypothetical protein